MARLHERIDLATRGSRGRCTSQGRPLRTLGALASISLLTSGIAVALPSTVHASSISTLKAKAAAIASKVDAANVKFEILSEEYDQASLRASALQTQIAATKKQIAVLHDSVTKDHHNITVQAIGAYVSNNSQTGVLPESNPNVLPLQQTYLRVAAGNLNAAISSLQNEQHRLSNHEAILTSAETQAAQATATVNYSRASAAGVEASLNGELQGVNAQLAPLVAQQEAAQQAAAQKAAAAVAIEAADQTSSTPNPASSPNPASTPGTPPPSSPASVTTTSSSAGVAAVQAAKSQLGVPYVWGGASAGSGFDCSGLAMWAWSQAGISLPHSAQAQYDSIPHVSMSALAPGDLIFYAEGGYIYHVIMYIGGGQAIQAETYGIPVSITPVWGGAYGAGRP